MPIRATDRPTELAACAMLNFRLIRAAAIARVHTANEYLSRNRFFRVTVA
jgi:hypothetical protein